MRSAYRSRAAPTVAVLLLLASVGVAVGIVVISATRPDNSAGSVVLGSVLSFVVPVVALVGTYGAIVGERTTGSVRFLLGLPNSRADAYLGKYVARSLVVLVPLLVGTLAAAAVVAFGYRDGSFLDTMVLGLAGIPFALVFVGVGLTCSAIADSDTRAVAAAIGAFILFRVGWPALQFVLLSRLDDQYPRPEWYFELGRINPINAYVAVTAAPTNVEFHPLLTRPGPNVDSVVVEPWFGAAVLLGWALLAPVGGYLYWRQRDVL
jgi:ABC-2 type transport system permease protein